MGDLTDIIIFSPDTGHVIGLLDVAIMIKATEPYLRHVIGQYDHLDQSRA